MAPYYETMRAYILDSTPGAEARLVDGVPRVLAAVRENPRLRFATTVGLTFLRSLLGHAGARRLIVRHVDMWARALLLAAEHPLVRTQAALFCLELLPHLPPLSLCLMRCAQLQPAVAPTAEEQEDHAVRARSPFLAC
jgi:hypothetical protein